VLCVYIEEVPTLIPLLATAIEFLLHNLPFLTKKGRKLIEYAYFDDLEYKRAVPLKTG
jgi:hypothetical protein